MSKKSFKDLEDHRDKFFPKTAQELHEEQQPHDTHEAQEANNDKLVKGTQGKKGHKLPRINMAFSQDNLE